MQNSLKHELQASMSKQKEDFINSVENAIHFFGSTPAAIITENLKWTL